MVPADGDRHESAFGNLHEAVADSHLQRADHAAAIHGDLFVVVDGGINDHLNAVHVGARTGRQKCGRGRYP